MNQCVCQANWFGSECQFTAETNCQDRMDNDNGESRSITSLLFNQWTMSNVLLYLDGLVDCLDPDCCSSPKCQSTDECTSRTSAKDM